jgi:undecaprenyl pyrophosphate phosphatase UppP
VFEIPLNRRRRERTGARGSEPAAEGGGDGAGGGATEFIPVSSTGHLILAGDWLGFDAWHAAETFDVFIQLGAILAVVWLYRAKILGVVRTLPREEKSRRLA